MTPEKKILRVWKDAIVSHTRRRSPILHYQKTIVVLLSFLLGVQFEITSVALVSEIGRVGHMKKMIILSHQV